jgi:hypothetical protein
MPDLRERRDARCQPMQSVLERAGAAAARERGGARVKPDVVPIRADLPNPKALDLEARVSERKRQLIEELLEHKKRSGLAAIETVDAIKRRLSELEHLIKQTVVDGWPNVGDSARARFELWIDR